MRRYITTLIFTFILLVAFPSVCLGGVTLVYPTEGAILPSRVVNFQWTNTDTTREYEYMIDMGLASDDWLPLVGISIPYKTNYVSDIPKNLGNNIMWRVKYCAKTQTPCPTMLSTELYSFHISESIQSSPTTPVVKEEKKTVVSTPPVISKVVPQKTSPVVVRNSEPSADGMAWNVNTSPVSKPFSFPLKEYIGVTQWHGNTAFQKPHPGIDFGAVRKEVLAIGDGEVVGKGWDSYNGQCMSGGNYLLIKHTNSMYSTFFHLQDTYVDVGKKVKKGDLLGISGNSGSWNCQPLAYHLHFETRAGRSQSTHVNPVDYIATDWSKVLTLNAKSNPQRLSGDNPHPSF